MQEVIFNDQGLVARKWVKLGGQVLYLEINTSSLSEVLK